MNAIKYNDTSDYTYMTVCDTEGVFTEASIDSASVPAGFYRYSLGGIDKESIDCISDIPISNHIGDFLTKAPINLGNSGTKALARDNYSFDNQIAFNFSAFFGKHLSIDCQIRLAEEKRTFQNQNDSREQGLDALKSEQNI